ncbi:NAD(P)/FAD-dependent oxidoreductase [Thermoflexus sp.]|uniref:NAD(P)/FAD-dependent oxidoreductase n=1 Tax=Thermoflexus sp. TaxID=1969742 RepID=UPI0025F308F6|nr:FAD-binding oxidoreductase [Thermoflexus sp.]MDW8179780.1 FAD-binding oxidoreductase [Anaerolineae bacterium]MCS6963408.1 FAD-binding oxidoreductase [Thermoflexus sp.]MCS7350329.1 FAD-binding oxidoreductase [Thermoflexus sp.]MCX7689826.1 FAD-binding oxidoreductase [Thermoflexus sp.]MDW8183686.1 FAD-binding oxidoreductase [Anaerolineae bacterium]
MGSQGFWFLTAGPYMPNPSLVGEERAEVAILGAGFSGLSSALHLKEAEQGLRVVVLEQGFVGYGASGRNAGFAMTLFGLTLSVTAMRFGRQAAAEAHHYMERAVDYVGELVARYRIDCDYERPGFLRVATSPAYVRRIRKEIELAHRLGLRGIEWLDAAAVREQVNSPLYLGAWWEPRCALLNPVKYARGLKRAAEDLGVCIYEGTPVLSIERRPDGFLLRVPQGAVWAEKVVFATNAYSHLLPLLRRKQVPAFTYIVLTEPLSADQLEPIGWRNRQGIEDARNLVHYYRLTPDNRLLMGGGDVGIPFGKQMDLDENERVFQELEAYIPRVFPSLRGVRIEHRWGGPVSVTMDMAPAIGFLGDHRAVYALGCIGHGVALATMNGQIVRDLILERRTALTDLFFVNRGVIPWPPEPIRFALGHLIRGYMRLEDRILDRKAR